MTVEDLILYAMRNLAQYTGDAWASSTYGGDNYHCYHCDTYCYVGYKNYPTLEHLETCEVMQARQWLEEHN